MLYVDQANIYASVLVFSNTLRMYLNKTIKMTEIITPVKSKFSHKYFFLNDVEKKPPNKTYIENITRITMKDSEDD